MRILNPVLRTVLSRFSNEFIPIDASEGFNRVYRLPPHHSPDFTREELEDILTAIRSTPLYDASLPLAPTPTNSSRSRGFYPNRGRGRGWNTEPSQNHGWRTSPSTTGPHPWGTNPTRGTWVSSQDQGSWRSQDTGGRGSGGDNRRPYRGGYSRGRSGWNHTPFANQSPSRGGPGSSRGRGSYLSGRGGPVGAPQAQYEALPTSDGNPQTTDMTGPPSLYPTGADTESNL
ncbi:hypothetical protein FRC12_001741 [Ceratobasidium sp. 428]|nr:hypothetical protein FRC12_001741 [Ceratobasidium sp. 428]